MYKMNKQLQIQLKIEKKRVNYFPAETSSQELVKMRCRRNVSPILRFDNFSNDFRLLFICFVLRISLHLLSYIQINF